MYLGSWKIDDLLTFPANTHAPSTGAATDADAVPAYRVYEDETATPILTGNMALLDSVNTTGFYSEQLTLSAANGLEKGKSYTIYISAAVGGVTGTISHSFQIEAEVDANVVSDKTGYALSAAGIDAVWDELQAGHVTAGSYGAIVTDSRLAELDAANLPADVDSILLDTGTTIPGTITTLQADTDDIQTRLPAALVGGRMDSNMSAIAGVAGAATNLEQGATALVPGACTGVPTTTVIPTDLTEVTVDHYKGRIVTFTSGNLAGQASDITAYSATGDLTVTALTDAPSAADTFVIS